MAVRRLMRVGDEKEGERSMMEVEKAEAFVGEHPHDHSAWLIWANDQPSQVKQVFRRIRDNTRTKQAKLPGRPIQSATLDASIPGVDDLSHQLRVMLDMAFAVWDRSARFAHEPR